MTDSEPKVKAINKSPDDLSFLSELQLCSINYQVLLRSNRQEENLFYLARLGLGLLNDLKKMEHKEEV